MREKLGEDEGFAEETSGDEVVMRVQGRVFQGVLQRGISELARRELYQDEEARAPPSRPSARARLR